MNKFVPDIYAKALFESNISGGDGEKIFKDLAFAADLLDNNSGLAKLFKNPSINNSAKKNVLYELLGAKLDGKAVIFLLLLVQNGRLGGLRRILKCLRGFMDKHSNIVRGTFESALEVTECESKKITNMLGKLYAGKRILVDNKKNRGIAGGFRITVGDTRYDYSAESYFKHIRAHFEN